ncbi:MAG: ferrochelatase, partial [Planctomycetaceae bacterium]|nr:ferrochelatase [Planctomycetaceae bacterium]
NSMSDGCDYVKQLTETCRLVAEAVGIPESRYKLVYQSRSGRPEDPWLEPDILDHLRRLKSDGVESVVISPIGFLSDHMEVLFDLDEEAALVSQEIGLTMRRAGTVGVHPKFVQMIRKLIQERLDSNFEKEAVGAFGPNWDVCPLDCCPAPRRRPQPAS